MATPSLRVYHSNNYNKPSITPAQEERRILTSSPPSPTNLPPPPARTSEDQDAASVDETQTKGATDEQDKRVPPNRYVHRRAV